MYSAYIYIYIRVSTSCAYTYTRERRTSPSSLASPRFSSSCTSTPSFFCLALAPSRYSRRITELRTKIEGNGSHCSSRISTLFLALFPPSTVFPTAFLDLSQKFRPSPIIGWIISIRYIYIYIKQALSWIRSWTRGEEEEEAVRWSMRFKLETGICRAHSVPDGAERKPVSRDWFKGWGSRRRDQGVFLVEIQVRRRINRIRLEIVWKIFIFPAPLFAWIVGSTNDNNTAIWAEKSVVKGEFEEE